MSLNQARSIRDTLARMDAAANDKSTYMQSFTPDVRSLLTYADAIASQVDRPDPTATPQANFLKLNANREKALKFSTAMLNRASALLNSAISDVQRREDERLGFTKGSPDRGAIIAKFSQMNQADQMNQVSAWMKDAKNGAVMLGVISSADGFLTGLTPELSIKLRNDFVKSYAPDLANERDELNEQYTASLAAARSMALLSEAISDPRRVEEIQRLKADHDAATAVFSGQPPA